MCTACNRSAAAGLGRQVRALTSWVKGRDAKMPGFSAHGGWLESDGERQGAGDGRSCAWAHT